MWGLAVGHLVRFDHCLSLLSLWLSSSPFSKHRGGGKWQEDTLPSLSTAMERQEPLLLGGQPPCWVGVGFCLGTGLGLHTKGLLGEVTTRGMKVSLPFPHNHLDGSGDPTPHNEGAKLEGQRLCI